MKEAERMSKTSSVSCISDAETDELPHNNKEDSVTPPCLPPPFVTGSASQVEVDSDISKSPSVGRYRRV